MNNITPKALQMAIWTIASKNVKYVTYQTITFESSSSCNYFSNSGTFANLKDILSKATVSTTYKKLDEDDLQKHKQQLRKRKDQRTAPKCVTNTIDKRCKIKLIKKIRNTTTAKDELPKDEDDKPIKQYSNLFYLKYNLLNDIFEKYCLKIEERFKNIAYPNFETNQLTNLTKFEVLLQLNQHKLYNQNYLQNILKFINNISKYISITDKNCKSCKELLCATKLKNSHNFLKSHNSSLEKMQSNITSNLSNNVRGLHIRSCIKIVTKMFKNKKSNKFLEITQDNGKDLLRLRGPLEELQLKPDKLAKISEEPNKIIIRLFAGNSLKDTKAYTKKDLKSKKTVSPKKDIPNPFKAKLDLEKTLTTKNEVSKTKNLNTNEKIALIEPKTQTLNSSIFDTKNLNRTQTRNAADKSNESRKSDSKLSPLKVKNLTGKPKKETLSKSKIANQTQNIQPKQISRRKKKKGQYAEPIIIADKIISKLKRPPKKAVPRKLPKQVTIKLPFNKDSSTPRPPSTAKKSAGSTKIAQKAASDEKKAASEDNDSIIEPWRKRGADDVDDGSNNTPWSRREAGLPTRPTGCFDPNKEDECKKRKNCKFVTIQEEGDFIWHRTISSETPTWILSNAIKVNNDFGIKNKPFIVSEKPQLNFKGLEIILPSYFNGGIRNYSCSKSASKNTCVETNQCGLKSSRDSWSPVEIKENFDQKGIPQGKKKCNTSKNKYSKFISIIKDAMSALVTVFTSHKNVEQVKPKSEKFLSNSSLRMHKSNNQEQIITSVRGVIRIIQLDNNLTNKKRIIINNKKPAKNKTKNPKRNETFINNSNDDHNKNETFFTGRPGISDILSKLFQNNLVDLEKTSAIKSLYNKKLSISKLLLKKIGDSNKSSAKKSVEEKSCLSHESKYFDSSKIKPPWKSRISDDSLSTLNSNVPSSVKDDQMITNIEDNIPHLNDIFMEGESKNFKETSTNVSNNQSQNSNIQMQLKNHLQDVKEQTDNLKGTSNIKSDFTKSKENDSSDQNFVELLVNQTKSDLNTVNQKTIELKFKQLTQIKQTNSQRPSLSALDLFRKNDESDCVIETHAESYSPLGTFQPRIVTKKRKSRKNRPGSKITYKDILAKHQEEQRILEYKRKYALRRLNNNKGVKKFGRVQIVVNKYKSNKKFKK